MAIQSGFSRRPHLDEPSFDPLDAPFCRRAGRRGPRAGARWKPRFLLFGFSTALCAGARKSRSEVGPMLAEIGQTRPMLIGLGPTCGQICATCGEHRPMLLELFKFGSIYW